ncbi:MAG: hypothetical protein SGCHY_004541 [Lobulomycetales sp.]
MLDHGLSSIALAEQQIPSMHASSCPLLCFSLTLAATSPWPSPYPCVYDQTTSRPDDLNASGNDGRDAAMTAFQDCLREKQCAESWLLPACPRKREIREGAALPLLQHLSLAPRKSPGIIALLFIALLVL